MHLTVELSLGLADPVQQQQAAVFAQEHVIGGGFQKLVAGWSMNALCLWK